MGHLLDPGPGGKKIDKIRKKGRKLEEFFFKLKFKFKINFIKSNTVKKTPYRTNLILLT